MKRPARPASRQEVLPRGLSARPAAPTGSRTARVGNPSGLLVVLVLAAAVTAACLFQVWTRAERLRLGYDLAQVSARVRSAESERAKLDVEVASLASPIRISHLATERLHLRSPEPGQVVNLGHRDGSSPMVVALARP